MKQTEHWMVLDEMSNGNYFDVQFFGGTYTCSCPHWRIKNDRHNHKVKPGPCKHINAVNGAKVSVRQRKYGHIVRMK